MSFYTTSTAHRPSSVYSSAPPPYDAGNESMQTRIAKLVLPIFAGFVVFMILPFPMGLILGAAISVGGLFFGGYLSGDAIKKLFSAIRPPRASLFNEEVDPPPPPRQTPSYGSTRMSVGPPPIYVAPPVYVAVPPPVPPPRYEQKSDSGVPSYAPVPPPSVSSFGSKPREHEGVNAGGRRSSIPNGPPPPYAAREREQVSS